MLSLLRWWLGLVRFGFRLLYNEMAFTYDTVSKVVSLGAWRCWQRSALKHLAFPPNSALILELAHGTGDLQIDLKNAGYQTIGYDLSPYMGYIARRKLAQKGLSAALVRGMAQQLPFADGQFNAVITTFPTDFIFSGHTLNEIYRVLTPDGLLIIVPNGVLLGGGALRAFLEWLYRITGQRQGEDDSLMGQVVALFEPYGFTVQVAYEKCVRNTQATVLIARKINAKKA